MNNQIKNNSNNHITELIYNDENQNLLTKLNEALNNCDEFYFAIAFITKSGLVCLKNILKQLEEKGIKGKILTGDYLSFSEPDALKQLLDYQNIELKVYSGNFHIKAYIFKNKNNYNYIIGSSNLTQSALKLNQEWNLSVKENDENLKHQIFKQFEILWNNANNIDDKWIKDYELKYQNLLNLMPIENNDTDLKPNLMQQEALKRIDDYIKNKASKVMIISSTGTGKTFLSAFLALKYQFKKVLFIVHREQILNQAMKSYQRVFKNQYKMGFLVGKHKDFNADYIFASVASLSKKKHLERFKPEQFDMICYDEVHKAASKSYLKIIDYFKPKLSFAMTATPIRSDGKDIFKLFDHNIAYEITLTKALENDLLCPFHYFGVADLYIDDKKINGNKFNKINHEQKVKHILDKIKYYGFSGNKIHGLVFVKDKKEAYSLADSFNKNGYKALALTSDDSKQARELAIKKLEEKDINKDYLDYIFTVDIFNEGVDIPSVNQVVMIRPTISAIIFTQQLGRGLRKHKDKDYVVIIDFIGNYQNNYLIPIALSGDFSFNKDNLRKLIISPNIVGCSTISFDKIAKNKILEAIDKENFSEIKKIVEVYKNLKDMLNRIPNYQDFAQFNTIDILRIIENSNFNSYYEFLCLKDKDYQIRISKTATTMLNYLSQKFLNGKRIYEVLLLKTLIAGKSLNDFIKTLKNKYHLELKDCTKNQLYLILSNNFNSTFKDKEKYQNAVFIDQKFKLSDVFIKELQDLNFKNLIIDCLNEAIRRYEKTYLQRYLDSDLVLYQKYSYEDVCRLLNWGINMVALNIGGYKYDKTTDTLPIFINYEKTHNTIYNNEFIDNSTIPFISKANRNIDSKEIEQFKTCNNIYLFLRKNKNDTGAKKFYFLGKVNLFNLEEISHKQKNYIKMYFKLHHPVVSDLYRYFINE